MSRIVFVLVLVIATARSLPAQGSPLDSARVRITAPLVSKSRLVGTVVAMESGVVSLREERAERGVTSIPLSMISFLEVSRGAITPVHAARRGMFKGASVGTLMGGAGGALWGVAKQGSRQSDTPPARTALRGAVVGGLAGALAGTILGSVAQERWEAVSVSSVALRPGAASVAITVTR